MELVQGDNVERFGPDQLWDLYRRSFPQRRRKAATQQVMPKERFDMMIGDPRWTKLVLVERAAADPLAGLAVLSDTPDTFPVPVRELAVATWPAQAAEARLWHLPFLVVDPEYHHTSAATHLVEGVWARAVATGGVVLVDTAAFNDTAVRLPSALFHVARSIAPRSTLRQIDTDGLWAYEFPEPVNA